MPDRDAKPHRRARIEAQIRKLPQLSPHFLIEQRRQGALVFVEIDPAWCAACAEERQGYAEALQHAVKADTGAAVEVRILDPGALARAG